jgi:hypothetical protein
MSLHIVFVVVDDGSVKQAAKIKIKKIKFFPFFKGDKLEFQKRQLTVYHTLFF